MVKLRRFDKSEFLKYSILSLMLVLMAFARSREGIAPFNLGMLAALFYAGQNMLILAPFYIVAGIIAEPTVNNLIVSIAPPMIFISVWILHRVTAREIKPLHMMLYIALSLIPQIVVSLGEEVMIYGIASVILTAIFGYVASRTAYAYFVKGTRYKFATDELIGIYAIILACGMGLYSFDVFGFKPFYIIAPFIILMAECLGGMNAIFIPLALGLGAGGFDGNIGAMSGMIVSGVFALIFIRNNVYLACVAYLLGDMLSGLFFNCYGNYHYLHIVAVLIGLLAFAVIPSARRQKFLGYFTLGESNAVRTVLKRSREDSAEKLISVSGVFGEIAEQLYGAKYIDVEGDKVDSKIAEEVSIEVCSKCKDYTACYAAMGGVIGLAYEQLVAIARTREVSVKDISPFLSSRCCNVNNLLSHINDKARSYNQFLAKSGQISVSRIIVAEQMRGVAEILSGLSRELSVVMSFDSERERKIVDELRYAHIICREIICESTGGWRIILVIRESDADKPELTECVERVIKCRLEKIKITKTDIPGYVSLEMKDASKYDIEVGVSTATKDGSDASGDTYSCGCIGGGKYILALSDGMGSGSVAHYNSCSTISMIENYYRAGFDNNIILTLINRILAEFNKESFTCLDMAVIDLNSGIADFIKLGGVEGLVKVCNGIEIIDSGALPMGIVDEAEPVTVRKVLTDGDIAVLMSDGVTDALGIDGVKKILQSKKELSMKDLSGFILDSATRDGAMDDTTVICARLALK